MCFASIVKEARMYKGLSQEYVASKIGITQAAYSKIENKKIKTVAADLAHNLAITLNSPRILAEYYFEKETEFFNVPVLNNVDDNPIVIIDTLIEEKAEAIRSCQILKKILKNKRSRKDITKQDWLKVMECEEQVADLYAALKLHFITMNEKYELDIQELEDRIYQKLKNKQYIKKELNCGQQ